MNKLQKNIIAIALSLLVSGCGTLARSSYLLGAPGELYPAVNADVQLWRFIAKPDPWTGRPSDSTKICFWRLFYMIDMPISLVTDTLFLHYDLIMKEPPIDISITDSFGEKVPDAEISVREINGRKSEGLTNQSGVYVFSGNHKLIDSINLTKDGYYRSYKKYEFKKSNNDKHQTWAPTVDIILRKTINPVPMYAKDYSINALKIPVKNEPSGYDLIAGDWVKPYGKGEISDIVFLLKRELKDEINFESTLDISTARPGDGFAPITPEMTISESDFKLPYEAPQDGYRKSLLLSFSASSDTPNKNNFVSGYKRTCEPEGKNFFIRIRSKTDGSGNVIKAMYGKIVGPVEYRIQECDTAKIRFTYYINPDYTRNIEFDSKKNLFKQK